ELKQTENPLDLAIEGMGFFQVVMPDGDLAYSRAGSFKKNSDGMVVTSNGYPLEPEINIPMDALSITIGSDGAVSITRQGEVAATEIGKIELANFINPAGLNSTGKNTFLPTDASGEPVTGSPGSEGFGTLLQGYQELSNVNIIEEMVNMIVGQRAYEINAKAIKSGDEMLAMANDLKR
ncbi:MAG: flagellar basal body rod protein FlgG, partial [Candidatus Schekmanbacteria bacterium RBG_13_48_7]